MEELIQSVYDSPEDWRIDSHCFIYKGNVSFWVSLGYLFFKSNPLPLKMTRSEKRRMWKAFKWWCSNAPLETFG